jgi:hypothetical protein
MTDSPSPRSPIVTFTEIKTVAVIRGIPSSSASGLIYYAHEALAGLRALLHLDERDPVRTQAAAQALANAARLWRQGVAAWRRNEVRSTFRYLTVLRTVGDDPYVSGDAHLRTLSKILLREAWAVVSHELRARRSRVDTWIQDSDPALTPESFYWLLESTSEPAIVKDPETAGYIIDEMRIADDHLHHAKSSLKLVALHLDHLRWLARRARTWGLWLSPVPSKRELERQLNGIKRLRKRLAAMSAHIRVRRPPAEPPPPPPS